MTARIGRNTVLQCQYFPTINTVRHGSRKPNTKKPAIPSWERACMDAATKPKYPEFISTKVPPWVTSCKQLVAIETEPTPVNKYEQLLVADVKKLFANKKMIIICQSNSRDSYEFLDARVLLFNNKMAFDQRGSSIYRKATQGTEYERCQVLFQGHTCLIHGDTSEQLAKLVKIEKKIPFVVVLGGIIEGRIMNRDELIWFAKLPDIDALRGELVHILGTAASKLSQNLGHHQMTLSQNLSRFVEDSTKSNPSVSEGSTKSDTNVSE